MKSYLKFIVGAAACAGALTFSLPSAAAQSAPARTVDCPGALTPQERQALWGAVERSDERTEAPQASLDDATLIATVERYAVMQLGQRVRPSEVDRLWAIDPPRRDVRSELRSARREGRLAVWLESLEPSDPDHHRLASERCRYEMIVDAGGWRLLPASGALKTGDESEVVVALRARLSAEGYALALTRREALFDKDLADRLRSFQRRHGLDEDGILGPQTRRELDVRAEDRLAQIEANLERSRWLPRPLPADRIEVDSGAATATLYRAGHPVLRMRAIVGDLAHKTPMFVSRIEAVIFNPAWNVPSSIAMKEILPKAARDPGYLTRNGFVRTPEGLRQAPGPANALGRLKFDLPSPFGVYLHDTPGRSAFARTVRTLSHGCMRLEKPRELAAQLLVDQGWSRDRIDTIIEQGATMRVQIRRPTPLFVIYRTSSVDEYGWATFSPDRYGWDRKLLMALANAGETDAGALLDSECSTSGS